MTAARRRAFLLLALAAGALALAAAWRWTPLAGLLDPEAVAAWAAPYRRAPWAVPAAVAAYVLLGFLLVPVLLLIFATGLVFGPWIGPLCALAGSLASASAAFGAGRRLGRETVRRLGGGVARKVEAVLRERGLLAVFLLRKIPAPFTLVNLAAGASAVGFRDFFLGTLLGMGSIVVLVSTAGWHLLSSASRPDGRTFAIGAGLFALSLATAFLLQRLLHRRAPA